MRTWTDENTGRIVRCLTDGPEASEVGYFRYPRQLPGGFVLAYRSTAGWPLITIDPASGEVQPFPFHATAILNIRLSDGRVWYLGADKVSVWAVIFPAGVPERVGMLPGPVRLWGPGAGVPVITCDGRTVIQFEAETDNIENYPPPLSKDAEYLWHWIDRPRRGSLIAHDLQTDVTSTIIHREGTLPTHHDVSPTDPALLKFAPDWYDGYNQRIWSVRTDGSELKKIRPQERGELITHEFWWPGGQYIAHKYQDRRNDPTIHGLPWAEYSPIPTQFGLANLDGQQSYLSDPLNHYHSHIFTSLDGSLLCGEGTDSHSFVYAANFSTGSTRIDFVPHATIHTPYEPFKGQDVHAGFSADGKWLIYNDLVDGKRQVCAVEVDF